MPNRAASTPLPPTADVVVIGAGVMGTSIACQLAARGITNLLVVDSASVGSGSSAKPIGGFRAQFSDRTNIQLGLRSVTEHLLRFQERYGVDIGADQCGYLFLITRPGDIAAYEEATALQRSLGLTDARMLEPAQVHELNPLVPASAVLAGQFSNLAGHALPNKIIEGYLARAVAQGVRVRENTPVRGITSQGSDALVETDQGTVRTGAVVVAAGAWSRSIGEMLGINLPVTPLRRQLAFTVSDGTIHPRIPFTLDAATTAYFHNVGADSLLFGLADPGQAPGFGRECDETWLGLFRRAAAVLAPSVAGAPVHSGWAGLYEMTPDCNALIGRTDGPGFPVLYATGFSGHGVLQSPAVGEVVADLYVGDEPFVDVSRFSADRFGDETTGLDRELAII